MQTKRRSARLDEVKVEGYGAVNGGNVLQPSDEMKLSEEDRCLVGLWAADCAERVLPLFEAIVPADTRAREAIEGIRAFARHKVQKGQLRPLVWRAYAAARESGDPVAAAAARSAGLAAATPYMHAQATLDQAKHALGSAMYSALARELAAAADQNTADENAAEEEVRWATDHAPPAVREIVQRFPVRKAGRSRQDALYYRLDAGLRG